MKTTELNFSEALDLLNQGHALRRSGWNGPDAFIVKMPGMTLPPFNTQGTERKVNDRTAKWIGEDAPLNCQPYVAMYTQQKLWQPGWLVSTSDLFATDWCVVESLPV